jgi:hypothetical protein
MAATLLERPEQVQRIVFLDKIRYTMVLGVVILQMLALYLPVPAGAKFLCIALLGTAVRWSLGRAIIKPYPYCAAGVLTASSEYFAPTGLNRGRTAQFFSLKNPAQGF